MQISFLSNCDFLQHSHNFYTNTRWARNNENVNNAGCNFTLNTISMQFFSFSLHSEYKLQCNSIKAANILFTKKILHSNAAHPNFDCNRFRSISETTHTFLSFIRIRNCDDHQRWMKCWCIHFQHVDFGIFKSIWSTVWKFCQQQQNFKKMHSYFVLNTHTASKS